MAKRVVLELGSSTNFVYSLNRALPISGSARFFACPLFIRTYDFSSFFSS